MEDLVAPWMDDELLMLREASRKFFQAEVSPNLYRWAKQGQVDREIWKKAGEQGLICAYVPEEYGGTGGNSGHDAVIFQELGRAGDTCFGIPIHVIATHYIYAFGSEQQKNKWLPGLVSGDLICGIAMTEPAAGSDLQGLTTMAIRDSEGYVLNGSKTYISNGILGNLFVVAAKTNPKEGARGISMFVVETDGLEGFSRGKPLEKIGTKGQDTAELFFDKVRLPHSALLGAEEGQGFYQMMQQLAWERLIIGLSAIGTMEFAFTETLKYVRERQIFGKTIFDFQNTKFKLAEIKTKISVTRAFVDECMVKHLNGELKAEEASMVKWWSTQVQCEILDECVQLHGGNGFMFEYPVARLYTDVRVQKIYGGSNETMKDMIARGL